MKNLLLPIALVAGLVCSPVILAEAAATTAQQGLVTMELKTSDGKNIRVLVHKDDVPAVSQLKKGDKIELGGIWGGAGMTGVGGGISW